MNASPTTILGESFVGSLVPSTSKMQIFNATFHGEIFSLRSMLPLTEDFLFTFGSGLPRRKMDPTCDGPIAGQRRRESPKKTTT